MRVTAISDILEHHTKKDIENRIELRTLNIGFDHVNRRLAYGHSRLATKILLDHLKCLSRRLDTYDMLRAVLQIEESRFPASGSYVKYSLSINRFLRQIPFMPLNQLGH